MTRRHIFVVAFILLILTVSSIPIHSDGGGIPAGSHPLDDPILIEGDPDFTSENGVSSGSGTVGDPYVIENKNIATTDDHGITIKKTTKHLVIRNCTLFGTSDDPSTITKMGVDVQDSSNITVRNCSLYKNYYSIYIFNTTNFEIKDNLINNTKAYGVRSFHSKNITVQNNSFITKTSDGFTSQYSDMVFISNNTFKENEDGIYLRDSTHVYVINNSFTDNENGIYATSINFGEIKGNSLQDNLENGIEVSNYIRNLIITDNICMDSDIGLYLNYRSQNNLSITDNNL